MKKYLLWIFTIIAFLIILFLGFVIAIWFDNSVMGKYQLYECVYHNAERNDFSQDPIIIEKIENECICFKYHIETKWLNASCDYKE